MFDFGNFVHSAARIPLYSVGMSSSGFMASVNFEVIHRHVGSSTCHQSLTDKSGRFGGSAAQLEQETL